MQCLSAAINGKTNERHQKFLRLVKLRACALPVDVHDRPGVTIFIWDALLLFYLITGVPLPLFDLITGVSYTVRYKIDILCLKDFTTI